MKSLKILIRALATYIASRCFRKLLSSEEVTENFLIQTFSNPDIEILLVSEFHPPYTPKDDLSRKILFTITDKEYEMTIIIRRWRLLSLQPKAYKITCSIKRYELNKKLTLCMLEYVEQLSLIEGNNGIISLKQFQWVE